MATMALKNADASLREEWLRAIQDLQNQVKTWAYMEAGWSTEWGEDHKVEEASLGIYTVATMNIYTPNGRLVLEPIARNYPGRGIVELYAWPTLFRVRLLHTNSEKDWEVRVDSGFTLHQEWNRENFIQLAIDLLGAS